MEKVKASIGRDLVSCRNDEIQVLRQEASLCDRILNKLRDVVTEGKLEYDD